MALRPAISALLSALLRGLLVGALAGTSLGQDTAAPPLRIAIKAAPPFAMPTADGQDWQGLSVVLWNRIAEANDLAFEWQPVESVDEILTGITEGRFDAGLGAITVTAPRQQVVDFSHPFHTSGLTIAMPEQESGLLGLLHALVSPDFLGAVAVLATLILIFGALVWLAERRRNPEQFGGTAIQGIGEGFWWSAVTMTTVGYGDRAPATRAGRGVGLIWMFASVITISGFTAAIASSITADRITGSIRGPEDLRGSGPVGTIAATSSDEWLRERGLPRAPSQDVDSMLARVKAGELNAAVFDAPLLRYKLLQESKDWQGLELLPGTFSPQDYAIALPMGSGLRAQINVTLLNVTRDPIWNETLQEVLGQE